MRLNHFRSLAIRCNNCAIDSVSVLIRSSIKKSETKEGEKADKGDK